MSDEPGAPAASKERKKGAAWAPPAAFAAAAFVIGLGGSAVGLTKTMVEWVRPPPPPKIGQEYLMIEGSDEDIKTNLQGVMEQVPGLHIVLPDWLRNIEADTARLKRHFCENNEATSLHNFSSAADPARKRLITACEDQAQQKILIGAYGLRSFDKEAVADLEVDVAVLSNTSGVIDALDGFVPGQVSAKSNCFLSSLSEDCIATRTQTRTLKDLPMVGPGEMTLIPIFLTVQFVWKDSDVEAAGGSGAPYDGYAATPFWFPTQVRSGKRVIIQSPRPMNETPSLSKGFYEGRG
ncbi:hypothetical protein LJR225_004526 [Phenylobacterium sp. LjRoot225]|uniref:hypothetical protein n=1 Tax=Phenylobacterium sp. LjRoot225 TaxID=3342285 RepID=UPI003ECE7F4E